MSPPGDETRELIASAEDRAKMDAAAELAAARREDDLKRVAHRERDMRRLMWLALVIAVAGLGAAATFWDDIVRAEVRIEQLEQKKHEPAKRSFFDRFR